MESTQQPTRTVDVTGLSDESIRVVEQTVAALREQDRAQKHYGAYDTYEEWSKAFREWAESHRRLDRPADDSRESIYDGRGE